MTPIRTLLFSAALVNLLVSGAAHAKVWISEFEAANTTGQVDQDGDAEDWLDPQLGSRVPPADGR